MAGLTLLDLGWGTLFPVGTFYDEAQNHLCIHVIAASIPISIIINGRDTVYNNKQTKKKQSNYSETTQFFVLFVNLKGDKPKGKRRQTMTVWTCSFSSLGINLNDSPPVRL